MTFFMLAFIYPFNADKVPIERGLVYVGTCILIGAFWMASNRK